MQFDTTRVIVEPDALRDVNAHDFSRSLASHGLEMVCKPDGIVIRKQRQQGESAVGATTGIIFGKPDGLVIRPMRPEQEAAEHDDDSQPA